MEKQILTPITKKVIRTLQAGDYVYITGTIYTARDAAHKRMYETMLEGKNPPFDLRDAVIYYLGPTPARPGQVIGSAGPTTSSRLDKYAPLLMEHGLTGMIGKGKRSLQVLEAIQEYGCVYFAAVGGAGALLSRCIKEAEVIAYEDLGTEAVRRLRVERLPVIVAADARGNNMYETAVRDYQRAHGYRQR